MLYFNALWRRIKSTKIMTTKSTFSISFVAQKGKLNTEGKAPILSRIIVNGQMTHFSTKSFILPDRWATKECRTLGLTKEEKEINAMLDDFRALIKSRYNEMVLRGEVVSAEKVKQAALNSDNRGIMMLALFDQFNSDYQKLVGKGTSQKTYTRYLLTRTQIGRAHV